MGGEPRPWKGPFPEDVLKKLAPTVIKYSEWYSENGTHLPDDFASDPGAWTFMLQDMAAAFRMIKEDKLPANDEELGLKMRGVQYFYRYMQELFL